MDNNEATAVNVQQPVQQPAERREDGLPVGRPFQRGTSGNPKGRPKGIKALIGRRTGESGEKLVRWALEIASNDENAPRDRMRAIEFLADRRFGKPLQAIEQKGLSEILVTYGGKRDTFMERVEFPGTDIRPLDVYELTRADIKALHAKRDDDDDRRASAMRSTSDDADRLHHLAMHGTAPEPVPEAIEQPGEVEAQEPDDAATESQWTLVTGDE